MPGRFPLVAVALTGDPFCEDGFCDDAGFPPPPFNPTDYLSFRWKGTLRKQVNTIFPSLTCLVSEQELTSGWRSTALGNYGVICFVTAFSSSGSFYGFGCGLPWGANREYGITGAGPNRGISAQNIGYIQDSSPSINYMQNFGSATGSFVCSPIVAQTIGGVWQFTNEAGPPDNPSDLVEWNGL